MNQIKIISYNVFWRALEANSEMKHCIYNYDNICVNNIAFIINSCINNNYDFIGLQEITKNQWEKILLPKLINNKNLINYNFIFGTIIKGGVITIYNKNKFYINYEKSGNLINIHKSEHRPYQFIIFNNNLIFINIQLPHKNKLGIYNAPDIKYNIDYIFYKIQSIINKNIKKYKIIIVGDFNNDNSFKNYKLYKYGFNMPLTNFPKTCCYNTNFNVRYDNIYSTFGYNKIYNLKKDVINKINNGNNWMSDHLPIISIITY